MFGLLKGASCGLSSEGKREWWQHICGVCLALHQNVGQVGRLTTNYDSALLSLLFSQQVAEPTPEKMGVCALRRPMQASTIAPNSAGAQFGGAMALIMASIKLKDQLADGDIGRWSAKRLPAQTAAARWEKQGMILANKLGFKAEPLFQLAQSQLAVEAQPFQTFAIYARPTEQAVGIAFGHTAILANQPHNVPLLSRIGEAYGRLMYLLDSYKDFEEDRQLDKFNPLAQTNNLATYESAARTLWRETHNTLTESILDLNDRQSRLSSTLLAQQLNRIGERALQLPHVCATCFSMSSFDDLSEEEKKNKEIDQGCDCGLGGQCCVECGCNCCCDCFCNNCCDGCCGGCC